MIAIIPARSGSKGLVNKNIKSFLGKPLIYYTIKEALNSNYINRVIVSTDSPKIANISQKYGAEVPFLRPVKYASDNSPVYKSIIYTMDKLDEKYDEIILLQPTNPLRTAKMIDESIELFNNKDCISVISISKKSEPLEWFKKIDKRGKLVEINNKENNKNNNRQNYDNIYLPNGMIYIVKYDYFIKEHRFYSDKTYPYIVEPKYAIDIDKEYEFRFAEMIYKQEMEYYNDKDCNNNRK